MTPVSQKSTYPLRKHDAEYTTPELLVDAGEQMIGAIIGSRVMLDVIREIESGGKV